MEFSARIDAYMTHCHSRRLSPQTMQSDEETLRLFEHWPVGQAERRPRESMQDDPRAHY